MRKTAAAALALTIVAGGVPAQVLPGFFVTAPIVASADASTLQNIIDGAAAGSTIKLTSDYNVSYLEIKKKITINLNGHNITGDGSNNVIQVGSSEVAGDLTITGSGKISGGNNWGGVRVNKGTFTLAGGTITKNKSSESDKGGGVTVDTGAVFNMTGGSITANTSDCDNGSYSGVLVNGGTFNLSGGEISGNIAGEASGGGIAVGGVYIQGGGTFNLSGTGSVMNNTAYSRSAAGFGGVYCYEGTANISGGTITGNMNKTLSGDGNDGAGLSAAGKSKNSSGGSIKVNISGKPVIFGNITYKAGNTDYYASDVDTSKVMLTVNGALISGAKIGLYCNSSVVTRTVTSGWGSYMSGCNVEDYFVKNVESIYDNVSQTNKPLYIYEKTVNGNLEVVFSKNAPDATRYTITSNVEHATVNVSESALAGSKVKFTIIPDEGYEFKVENGKYQVFCNGTLCSRDNNGAYSFTITENSVITATIVKKNAEETDASCAAHQIIVSGDIGLNYLMRIPGETGTTTTSEMEFTVPGRTGSDKVVKVKGKKSSQTGYTDCYEFTCPLYAKEMNEQVAAKLYSGTSVIWNDKEEGYSVKDYYNAAYNAYNDVVKNILDAMLDYGAAAQTYFGYQTTNLANGGTTKYSGSQAFVPTDEQYKFSGSFKLSNGASFYGASLDLTSSLKLNLYFENADVVTHGNDKAETVYVKGKYLKRISIAIKPWKLTEAVDVSVDGATFKYSPANYIYEAFSPDHRGFAAGVKFDNLRAVLTALNKFGYTLNQ